MTTQKYTEKSFNNFNDFKLPVIQISYFDKNNKRTKRESYPLTHFLDQECKSLKKVINFN